MTTEHEHNLGQLDAAIEEAKLRVAKEGYEQADTKVILLAGFGWLGSKIDDLTKEMRNNNSNHGSPWGGNKKVDLVIKVGSPMAVGAGIMGALLTLINKIAGG